MQGLRGAPPSEGGRLLLFLLLQATCRARRFRKRTRIAAAENTVPEQNKAQIENILRYIFLIHGARSEHSANLAKRVKAGNPTLRDDIVLETYRKRLEAVSASCAKSNPDLLHGRDKNSSTLSDLSGRIRLADMTRLMMTDFSDRRCQANIQSLSFWWNIKNDALSSQSDECVGFIYDTLWYLNR